MIQASGPIAKLADVITDPGKAKSAVDRYQKAEAAARTAAGVARKETTELKNLGKDLEKREKKLEDTIVKNEEVLKTRVADLQDAEDALKKKQEKFDDKSGKFDGERRKFRKDRNEEIARLEALGVELDDKEKELRSQEATLKAGKGNLKSQLSKAAERKAEYDGKLAELRRIVG